MKVSTTASTTASTTPWFVYLLACEDGSLYAGVTTDPARRLREHQTGRGARYTRARGAVELVWLLEAEGRSEALRLEAAVKRLPRRAKLLLCFWGEPASLA